MNKFCRHYLRHAWSEGLSFDEDGLEFRKCYREGCDAVQWARYSLKLYRTQGSGALVPISVQWVWDKERARMPQAREE